MSQCESLFVWFDESEMIILTKNCRVEEESVGSEHNKSQDIDN